MIQRLLLTRATALVVFSLLATNWNQGQDQPRNIGSVNFYGTAGLNLDEIRAALPIHKGDPFPGSSQLTDAVKKAVSSAIGKPPTEVASVCCDANGGFMIYVGLPGTSIKHMDFNTTPTGASALPAEILKLYEQAMDESRAAVLNGTSNEDTSKGYSLALNYPSLRAKQLQVREYAVQHDKQIRSVLESSKQAEQRSAAAYLLGYVQQSQQQIDALVRATSDVDEGVRNNATRALGVLAESNKEVAAGIPAAGFIRMLSSGSWSDRNKAGWVLLSLTKTRPPKLLAELRSESLVSLVEMARWRTPHAVAFRVLLGRVAGIEEGRLSQLANADNPEEIIKAVGK